MELTLENLYTFERMHLALLRIEKISGWKSSVQNYLENEFINLSKLRQSIINKTYKPLPPHKFKLNERGKLRLIESLMINDIIVQKVFIDHVLLKLIRPKLQYDNSASLSGRGVAHFRERLDKHLHDFYKENGNWDGYIYIFDFTKFFDNINHNIAVKQIQELVPCSDLCDLIELYIRQHKIDVSYMSESEYEKAQKIPFSSLDYNLENKPLTGDKYLNVSVGIGSPLAQIFGIYYPHKIDNYFKIVKGVKLYARYMDDGHAIDKSKEFLWELDQGLKSNAKDLGIFVNEKKTKIVKLSHKFTILKIQYICLPGGKIIHIVDKSAFKRERRRLKAMGQKVNNGKLTLRKAQDDYLSWRGSITLYGEIQSVKTMDNLFESLIGNLPKVKNKRKSAPQKRRKRYLRSMEDNNYEFDRTA